MHELHKNLLVIAGADLHPAGIYIPSLFQPMDQTRRGGSPPEPRGELPDLDRERGLLSAAELVSWAMVNGMLLIQVLAPAP